MSAFFVTATGTDIGKTYVTAGLIRRLRAQGKAVSALKPVVSGFDDPCASDTGLLLAALGEPATDDAVARLSPWRFAAPLSPDMAAAREGRAVDFDVLLRFCRRGIAECDGTLFIEGVGGIMVPLDGTHTVLDWAAALGLPLILVTGSYLGTLSHSLTALRVAAGLRIAAIVVNETPGSTVAMDDTVATLRRFAPGIPVVALARGAGDFAALAAVLDGA
jgi:dethiobiotin synthetase